MSAPVKLPAIFSGIRSRKDKSYSLSFETRELGGGDAGVLLGMNGAECWLLIAPDDSLDAVDVPAAKPDSLTPRKSPAARQRSVMFIYWKQQGGGEVLGDFDGWYASVIERNISQWKAKLDSPESGQ